MKLGIYSMYFHIHTSFSPILCTAEIHNKKKKTKVAGML